MFPGNHDKLTLAFPIEPMAIQSARFFRSGNGIRAFQPEKNISYKQALRIFARNQLPQKFTLFDSPVRLEADFSFLPPKSMRKRDLAKIAAGEIVYKPTRGDLCDNLLKGLCDAMTGIVWSDDSIICEVSSRKRYGTKPFIDLVVIRL